MTNPRGGRKTLPRDPPKSEPHKREATVFNALPTPNQSMVESSGTVTPITPKQEDLDDEKSLSNTVEGVSAFSRFNHGLPIERETIDLDDEGQATQAQQEIKRNFRSPLPSILSSFPGSFRQPSVPRHPSVAPPSLPRPSMVPSIAPIIGASLEIVGEKVNLLVDAIEELRKLGLNQIDTELPELVLVGDQSAGKSSLMGAIAEINLPKDQGMCTRCPANIKTLPGASWSCSVSLHETYHFTPDARRNPTKSNPFPPWVQNDDLRPVIRRFKKTSDKAELENILKWAQIALLNPSQDYYAFIPGTGTIAENGLKSGHKNEADYSPNIVAIDISGPRLPALSFYDLPGIFFNPPLSEQRYLIKVFENLAAKYIQRENAIVICAITMAADPSLSKTSAIIGDLKAEKRTIGVLTMPDRLQEGSTHADYDAILKNKAHVLPRGYFVTKQPGPDFDPGEVDYHVQARLDEEQFFKTSKLWAGEWQTHRERCGTAAIQTYLSQEFAKLIANSMPNIEERIKAQAEIVDNALRRLPELPNHNVQNTVHTCLQKFSNGVLNFLEGNTNSNDFLSSWSTLSADFGQAIQKMKPMFVYTDPSDFHEFGSYPEVISIDDDSDCETISSFPPSTGRKHPNDFASPNSKRAKQQIDDSPIPFNRHSGSFGRGALQPREEDGRTSPAMSFTQRPIARGRLPARQTAFDQFLGDGKGFKSIADVRQTIYEHRLPGHPDNVTYRARETLCLEVVKLWEKPLQALCIRAFSILQKAIIQALDQNVGNYKQTDLYKESKAHLLTFLDQCQKEQCDLLERMYELEKHKLFTLNDDTFKRCKADELTLLRERRKYRRAKCFLERQAKLDNRPLDAAKLAEKIKTVKDEQLGPDPWTQEIDLAAYVRGYYRTAGLRFADVACQIIQGTLFRLVQDKIMRLLETRLGIEDGDGEAKCRSLMVEDHAEARERAALQNEKVKLTQAAARLEQLVQDLGYVPEVQENAPFNDLYDDEPNRARDSPPRAETAPLEDGSGF